MDHTMIGTVAALALVLPIAARWQIPLGSVVAAIVALGASIGLVIAALPAVAQLDLAVRALLVVAGAIAAAIGLLAYRFYRDPDRSPPDLSDAVLSPADGRVVYVLESKGGQLPVSTKQGRPYRLDELTRTDLQEGDAIVIGIGMNLADVHVNRAPIAGRVTLLRHLPGSFGSLRKAAMIFENERATTVISGEHFDIAVVQIASRLVRRIASFVRPGDEVRAGARIGAIRFGSQVDVVIAKRAGLVITTAPGARLRAGESVIATIDARATSESARS